MTSDSAPRIADSCVCVISIEALANFNGDGEVVLRVGEMILVGLRKRLFGFGKEEEDAEEDELSLDETSDGLSEDERDRVPMVEAKTKS